MTKAVVIEGTGGVDVLKLKKIPIRAPKKHEVLVRNKVLGINYIDIYQRTGAYAMQGDHLVPGIEGVGVVEAIGQEVQGIAIGDRVAYGTAPWGAYAELTPVLSRHIVLLPPEITDEQAAAVTTKGLIALLLASRAFPLIEGNVAVVHAASGGVGHLLCQMAKIAKATVIATVGSKEKQALAQSCGADYVYFYDDPHLIQHVSQITRGNGVNVVYDGVGRTTLDLSLEMLMICGMFVSYGQSSGAPAPLEMYKIAKRSLFVTRPSIFHYVVNRTELVMLAMSLFDMVKNKHLKVHITNRYHGLEAIPTAHHNLETRRTQGSSIVIL